MSHTHEFHELLQNIEWIRERTMSRIKAIEFLLDNACRNHKWECACVVNGRIDDSMTCSCGATDHNSQVVDCIMTLCNSKPSNTTISHKTGIESPTWKFDDEV